MEKSPPATYPPMGIGATFWWRDALPPQPVWIREEALESGGTGGVEKVCKDDTAHTFGFLFRFNRVWINSRLLLLFIWKPLQA